MDLRILDESFKTEYDQKVTHVIQSWQWGEFRKSLGIPLLRFGIFEKNILTHAFQISFHQIPLINKFVGYLPKGPFPDSEMAKALKQISAEQNCVFIKTEPDVEITNSKKVDQHFKKALKPLFTKYNFVIDLTPSEEELLASFHQKTRYNIKVAHKKGVKVEVRDDEEALRTYLKLYFDTTKRQGYFGHNENYHSKVFETFSQTGQVKFIIASYNNIPLTAWMLLIFKDKLYYPYGGSSHLHRDVMSSNLVAWEAIKLGKSLGLKEFDMWGALGPEANPKDPWFGFHRFKQGYGGRLVEYLGSFDLVANAPLYYAFNSVDKFTKVKVALLKALGR
jgi:lipid II:glycine glycyltransferase (peptidoglycan interpeptide bridge formation enzyme)